MNEHRTPPRDALSRRLARPRLGARMALWWERAWPKLVPLFSVVALFLAAAWLGVWPMLPEWGRIAGLALFALAVLASLAALRGIALPGTAEADRRIETASGLADAPLTTQSDRLAPVAGAQGPLAEALWKEHRARMAARLENLRVGTPSPAVAARDPWGLRAVPILLLFIGAVAAFGQWGERLAEPFRSHVAATERPEGRIDAWVSPPAYTNRPPIFLTRDARVDVVEVPEGSVLTVRVPADSDLGLTVSTPVEEVVVEEAEATDDNAVARKGAGRQFRFTLGQTARAIVARPAAGESVPAPLAQWHFNVLPDADPTITLTEGPEASSRGALEFAYAVTDDYGVVSAKGTIAPVDVPPAMPDAALAGEPRPLVEAPELALPLPTRRAKEGTARLSRDLTAHPWAGARVSLTLEAVDEAGQTGRSDAAAFTLPERVFTKPLAKAIVFERRRLAMDARQAKGVARMLDIITSTSPEKFIEDKGVYMGLRVAMRRTMAAPDDDRLREVLPLLWDLALAVEDGDLSRAERRLRDAQERLSEALENGASNEEIERLMDELRQAMAEFMQEMAERMANQPREDLPPMDPNAQAMNQQDLERMMQQIEDLAKSGSRDAARQLLQEMQRMMNNLQMAQPGQQQNRQDPFSQQMNKLGEMMREQQRLMDETFRMQREQQRQQGQQGQQGQQQQQRGQQQQQGQRQQGQQQGGQQQGQGQQPMTAEELEQALEQLRRQQGQLGEQMQQLQEALEGMGQQPSDGLGEAGEAMGQAEGELGQGQTGDATDSQGRALRAMRQGAQQMMREMQNQAGEQGRQGERGQHGEQSRADRDPLGRRTRSRGPQLGDDVKIPGEIDAQRARRILEAIRRRLGETQRPRLELDYLDRLLPTR